jgi:hypothetical protein
LNHSIYHQRGWKGQGQPEKKNVAISYRFLQNMMVIPWDFRVAYFQTNTLGLELENDGKKPFHPLGHHQFPY